MTVNGSEGHAAASSGDSERGFQPIDAAPEHTRRATDSPRRAIDFDGTLLLPDMVDVLSTSARTIHKRLKARTFPIPPLPRSVDNKLRWSGPIVRQWLERNGREGRRDGEHGTKRNPAARTPRINSVASEARR